MDFVNPKRQRLDQPPKEESEDEEDELENYRIEKPTSDERAKVVEEFINRPSHGCPKAEADWRNMKVTDIQMIRNNMLLEEFKEYKWRNNISRETIEYRAVFETCEIQKIAEEGLRTGSDIFVDIGDRSKGVMLYWTPAMAYSGRFLYKNVPIKIMAFRVADDRKGTLPPPKNQKTGEISPSKTHNGHIPRGTEDSSKSDGYPIEYCRAGVYHYEYKPGSGKLYAYPSMILPHAIITFELHNYAELSTPGKIDSRFLNFYATKVCKHTIGCKKKAEGTIYKPYKEIPAILCATEATPNCYHVEDLHIFPELLILRTPEYFGKLLTSETVYFVSNGTHYTAAHYILKISNKHKQFHEMFRDNKSILVCGQYPWTVFYLPTGQIGSAFGFPHSEMCFHLVVLREQTEENFKSFFIGEETLADEMSHLDLSPVDSADDTESDTDSDEDGWDISEQKVDAGLDIFEHNSPASPTKGILRTFGSRLKSVTVTWNDEKNEDGKLSEIKHFDDEDLMEKKKQDAASIEMERKQYQNKNTEQRKEMDVRLTTSPTVITQGHRLPLKEYTRISRFLPEGATSSSVFMQYGYPPQNLSFPSFGIPPPGLYFPPPRTTSAPCYIGPNISAPVDSSHCSTSKNLTITPDFSKPPPNQRPTSAPINLGASWTSSWQKDTPALRESAMSAQDKSSLNAGVIRTQHRFVNEQYKTPNVHVDENADKIRNIPLSIRFAKENAPCLEHIMWLADQPSTSLAALFPNILSSNFGMHGVTCNQLVHQKTTDKFVFSPSANFLHTLGDVDVIVPVESTENIEKIGNRASGLRNESDSNDSANFGGPSDKQVQKLWDNPMRNPRI